MPKLFKGDDSQDRPRRVLGPPTGGFDDRLPPQNIEAELGVLGAILIDNDVLHEIIPILRAEDFYRDAHQILYATIRDLYDLGRPLDAIILEEELRRRGEYEKVGGEDLLESLLNSVPHAANALFHAKIVRQKAVARDLIASANEILREGYANKLTSDELLELAERRVFAIAEEQVQGETVEIGQVVTKAMERISLRAENRHDVVGIPTGFYDLDDLTGGFQPSQLIIIAARPSMGKTAFALNICEHVAVEHKTGVLFVSLEMGQMELAERLLCARAKVDGQRMKKGKLLGARELAMLGKAFDEMHGAPLFIDDTPARNMLQITANSRRLKMRQDIGLIVVDYIQLVDAEESRDSRQEQIAKISRRLKTLARELHVPVVALSQLNRQVENREDKEPRLADLRESGAIEQDADIVLMLHRPEYYDRDNEAVRGVADIIVSKNRNGSTGKFRLSFLREYAKFENHSPIAESGGVSF